MAHATPTSLWLLRHPEPELRARGRCYGSLDVALSVAGLKQAHDVAGRLRREPFAAICTSPRQRCRQAAAILAIDRECAVETMDSLAELDFGDLEGRTYDEIAAAYPELYRQWMERPTETTFPGGESFQDMWMRVIQSATLLRTRYTGQTVAIVTHAGPIRILLADALGTPPANIFRIGQSYGAVNLIRYFGDYPVVDLVNSVLPPTL